MYYRLYDLPVAGAGISRGYAKHRIRRRPLYFIQEPRTRQPRHAESALLPAPGPGCHGNHSPFFQGENESPPFDAIDAKAREPQEEPKDIV